MQLDEKGAILRNTTYVTWRENGSNTWALIRAGAGVNRLVRGGECLLRLRTFFQDAAHLCLITHFMLLTGPRVNVRIIEMRTRGEDNQRGDGNRQEEYEQKDAIQDQAHLPVGKTI